MLLVEPSTNTKRQSLSSEPNSERYQVLLVEPSTNTKRQSLSSEPNSEMYQVLLVEPSTNTERQSLSSEPNSQVLLVEISINMMHNDLYSGTAAKIMHNGSLLEPSTIKTYNRLLEVIDTTCRDIYKQ